MQNKRKTLRLLTCQRTLIFFACVIGILNLALNSSLKPFKTDGSAADESKVGLNEEYTKLRGLHEILIKDCNSKESHSKLVVYNLTREVHSLEVTVSTLRDARDKLIAREKDYDKQLFEANARYRAAEIDYEIARSKESGLKNQIEEAKVREKALISRLEKLQRQATTHNNESYGQLRLDTALVLHPHLAGGLVSAYSLSAFTNKNRSLNHSD